MAGTPRAGASRWDEHARQLGALKAEHRLRALRRREGLDFSSNDYLGLAGSAELSAALVEGIEMGLPAGSGGSRLLRGNHPAHEELEAAAAPYGQRGGAVLPTGFAANAGIFATLPQRGDLVLHDELIHASAHDGMKLGRAETRSAPHNDAQAFENAVGRWRQQGGTGRVWIAVESLYSMDGDRAPIADLAAIADRHDAMLIIDEAHATGVFGPQGRGLAADIAGHENVVTLHTCGKALGSEGALVCAPRIATDFLVNRARPFIFSTAPSPLTAHVVHRALEISAAADDRRAQLHALSRHAESKLAHALGVEPTGSQIIPVIIGDDGRAMGVAGRLQDAGFDIRGIRPPTVPAGTARLRCSVTLNVTEADIDALVMAMEDAMARVAA